MTCCLPGSSPSRHFDRREDPGDEVGLSERDVLLANKKYDVFSKANENRGF